MNAMDPFRQGLIDANRSEYGEAYASLHFPTPAEAGTAIARREELLAELDGKGALWGCNGTKLDCRTLSPGCRLCVEGVWSCLFITGSCNCRCFYCPTPQEKPGEPTTNTLRFPQPPDYLDYLSRFGFRGVSISGGEPLLAPEKTLQYIAAVRRRFGEGMHIWLYTNGTLVTRDLLLRLRGAGLNEIRFDLGAIGYRLDPVRLAAGVIEHLTVEIPAIPEDLDLLRMKMVEMAESGVRYLNLHQLRLTPYNFPALTDRGYTFVHGAKVTVLESELTALELLRHALDRGLPLGVNYCSFVYKNRFQSLAARLRYAPLVKKPWDEVTGNGYLRTLSLSGSAEDLKRQAEVFSAAGAPRELWELGRERLVFSGTLWPHLLPGGARLRADYSEAALLPAVSYRNPFVEIKLNKTRKVFVERRTVGSETEIAGFAREALGRAVAGVKAAGLPEAMVRFEFITEGMQDYF